jgi:hypothetical protein
MCRTRKHIWSDKLRHGTGLELYPAVSFGISTTEYSGSAATWLTEGITRNDLCEMPELRRADSVFERPEKICFSLQKRTDAVCVQHAFLGYFSIISVYP